MTEFQYPRFYVDRTNKKIIVFTDNTNWVVECQSPPIQEEFDFVENMNNVI